MRTFEETDLAHQATAGHTTRVPGAELALGNQNSVLRLQRTIGNRAVGELIHAEHPLHPRLGMSATQGWSSGLDRRAVLRTPQSGLTKSPSPIVQRKCAECEDAPSRQCPACLALQQQVGNPKAATSTQPSNLSPPGESGVTRCNFPGGIASEIITTGCDKPCVELHEESHRKDAKSCCDEANIEYFLAGKDERRKYDTISKWNKWVQDIHATTECRAYKVSDECFTRAVGEKNCDNAAMKPADGECCALLNYLLKNHTNFLNELCASATPTLPKCPFGQIGP